MFWAVDLKELVHLKVSAKKKQSGETTRAETGSIDGETRIVKEIILLPECCNQMVVVRARVVRYFGDVVG
jgi:hypothetical protein